MIAALTSGRNDRKAGAVMKVSCGSEHMSTQQSSWPLGISEKRDGSEPALGVDPDDHCVASLHPAPGTARSRGGTGASAETPSGKQAQQLLASMRHRSAERRQRSERRQTGKATIKRVAPSRRLCPRESRCQGVRSSGSGVLP